MHRTVAHRAQKVPNLQPKVRIWLVLAHKLSSHIKPRALRKHLYRLYGVPVLGVADHSALQELQDAHKALQLDTRELRRALSQQTQHAQDLQAQVQQLQSQLQLAGTKTHCECRLQENIDHMLLLFRYTCSTPRWMASPDYLCGAAVRARPARRALSAG